jgi:hypothetical protein
MANELSTDVKVTFSMGGTTMTMSGVKQINVSTNASQQGTVTVALAGTALPLGNIATPGVFVMRNTDGTNYVTIGNSGDPLPLMLKAGEWGLFRWATGMVPYAAANGAPVVLHWMLIAD